MVKPDPISAFLDMITCEAIGAALDQLADGGDLYPMTVTANPREPHDDSHAMDDGHRADEGQSGVGKTIVTRERLDFDTHLVQTIFGDDTPDVCLIAARKHIRDLGASIDAYALVYDGFIQESSSMPAQDALIVEFGERGSRCAYSAYVTYRQPGTEMFAYDDPQPAGEGSLLLG